MMLQRLAQTRHGVAMAHQAHQSHHLTEARLSPTRVELEHLPVRGEGRVDLARAPKRIGQPKMSFDQTRGVRRR